MKQFLLNFHLSKDHVHSLVKYEFLVDNLLTHLLCDDHLLKVELLRINTFLIQIHFIESVTHSPEFVNHYPNRSYFMIL